MANKGRPKYQRLLQYTEKHNESMTKVATKGLEKILSRDK